MHNAPRERYGQEQTPVRRLNFLCYPLFQSGLGSTRIPHIHHITFFNTPTGRNFGKKKKKVEQDLCASEEMIGKNGNEYGYHLTKALQQYHWYGDCEGNLLPVRTIASRSPDFCRCYWRDAE